MASNSKQSGLEAALAQIERCFGKSPAPTPSEKWLELGFNTTHEQTEEDRAEADHQRVESHPSRFI